MRNTLAVQKMTDRALWARAFLLVRQSMPLEDRGPKDREVTLKQLQAVLKELELRGSQLSLLPEPDRSGVAESTFGIRHHK